MIFYILRGVFIVLLTAVTALYLLPNQWGAGLNFSQVVVIMATALAIGLLIIFADAGTRQKRLSAMSGVFLGLIAGLVVAYPLSFVVDLIGLLTAPMEGERKEAYLNLLEGVKVIIGLITCYAGISLVLQTKDDFRFVIPYVEFAKEIRGNRPTILDTSIIVDGRILDIIETGVVQGAIVLPKFVLDELHVITDSADKLRRTRGRRGLDILKKLQDSHQVEVSIDDTEVEGTNVDQKLITLSQRLQGRVMTNDFNLNKVATLRGVDVINLNDLAKALRPVVLPGEHMTVRLVKTGEAPTQGVGYLADGTMIVVENARDHIGEEVAMVVTSTLQTSAGRMIFGRFHGVDAPAIATGPPITPSGTGQAAAADHATDQPVRTDAPTGTGPKPPSRRNPRRTN